LDSCVHKGTNTKGIGVLDSCVHKGIGIGFRHSVSTKLYAIVKK